MKKLVVLALLLTACSSKLKQGSCYANDTYGRVAKVTKVMAHGAFLTRVEREPVVRITKPYGTEENYYISWDVLERDNRFLYEIDCEAFEKFKEGK